MKKLLHQSAQATSIVFHPLLIPTLGFLLLFNSGFYFALIPWNLKRFVLLVIFLSTCLLPALTIGLLSLNQRFDIHMSKSTDRVLPLIFSSLFSYVGYLILQRIPIYPIYNFLLVASILVQIALMVISLRWKISAHAAAIGGLIGGFLALSFRMNQSPLMILSLLFLIGGLVGTARLILEKHTNIQVYAGFVLGFLIMDLIVLFA
jgi:membrane-associated phospholipid phosphatase